MSKEHIRLNPEAAKKFRQFVQELCHSLQRQEDEKEAMKDLLVTAEKEFGISKGQIKKIAVTEFKRNFEDVAAEQEEFQLLYENVMKSRIPEAVVDEDDDDAPVMPTRKKSVVVDDED